SLRFTQFIDLSQDSKMFYAAAIHTTLYLDVSGIGAWSSVANSNFGTRNWGSSVMYDDGKVLLMGGTTCGFYANCAILPTATAEIIDLNSSTPVWKYTGSLAVGRKLHNATLLPDGKVLVTGGDQGTADPNDVSNNHPVYTSELWDPATGTWSTMASLSLY